MPKRLLVLFVLYATLNNVNAQQKLLLAPVMADSLWGYIDVNGNFIIKPQFTEAKLFKEGLAPVAVLKKDSAGLEQKLWGYIDKTGNFVIKPAYFQADYFYEGIAAVAAAQWMYIDKKGKILVKESDLKLPTNARKFYPVHEGMGGCDIYEMPQPYEINIKKRRAEETGILSTNPYELKGSEGTYGLEYPGEKNNYTIYTVPADAFLIRTPCPEETGPFLSAVSGKDKYAPRWGFKNQDKLVIDTVNYAVSDFNEGLAYFIKPGRSIFFGGYSNSTAESGFMDATGKPVFYLKYEFLENFCHDRAAVLQVETGKVGFINKKGETVINPQYKKAGNFTVAE